mmetsp:Transcript_23444/g.65037  ORF Transcript_23444/g.65037 Transcript_23444/m.65037 type:complete len:625 (+) Transcript_23444:81-1955(+)|eukprot:CAMPEP_0117669826 /NCGR_PEP_ID=MMETSP0804-20121206/12366_1 /TAXON_ID=1074897 /ORGANISM="Tetraselmis astigmatica, Strain CCMP880" /LENGTH=624 /DNA_ID=CAMNT_0005477963 /DNA_START=168 /DNA_END=2042 /DNA_ORIENTATION=+
MGLCTIASSRVPLCTGAGNLKAVRRYSPSALGAVARPLLHRTEIPGPRMERSRCSRAVTVKSGGGDHESSGETPPSEDRMGRLLAELDSVFEILTTINSELNNLDENWDDEKLVEVKRCFNRCRAKSRFILEEIRDLKFSELGILGRGRLWLLSKYLEFLCSSVNAMLDMLSDMHLKGKSPASKEGQAPESPSPTELVSQITSKSVAGEQGVAGKGGLEGSKDSGRSMDSSMEIGAVKQQSEEIGESILAQSFGFVSIAFLAVYIAEWAGLDVQSSMRWPEHPLQLAKQCFLWTTPSALASLVFWPYMLKSSKSPASAVFRKLAKERADFLIDFTTRDIALISLALETSSGLVFRGVGLAAATVVLAGIPSVHPDDAYILSTYQEPAYMVHFPAVWQWPFIAVATATAEAWAFQLGQGGFFEISYRWVQSQASLSFMQAMPVAQLLSLRAIEGNQDLQDSNDNYEGVMLEGLATPLNAPTQNWEMSHLLDFLADFSMKLALAVPMQTYMPLMVLVRGTLLSAEAILTGSLWCSILTGAVLMTIEECSAKDFLEWEESEDAFLDEEFYSFGFPGAFNVLEAAVSDTAQPTASSNGEEDNSRKGAGRVTSMTCKGGDGKDEPPSPS